MTFFDSLEKEAGLVFGKDQRASIMHFEGPALTLAIPGSGKTTLMLARALHLTEVHGLPPKNLLNLTFSKAAATDMSERYVSRYRAHFSQEFEFSTIHSFAYRILAQIWKERCIRPKTLLSYNRELLNAASEHVVKNRLNDDQFETLSNQIGYARNMMYASGTLSVNGLDFPEIDAISDTYESLKRQQNVMDFDDLLLMTLKLLQEDAAVLNRLRRRYPFVQIDEAQDTSKVQHEILKRLVYPTNHLFIVADDDQSIYGFRGASPELLLGFQSQFPGGLIFHLNNNYRSRQEIIQVCSTIIRNNQTRYEKALSTTRGIGGAVRLLEFETYAQRNSAITEHLKTLPDQTIGILYRNHLSGLSVMDALLDAGIPFHIESNRRTLSEHWMLRDLEAFLALSRNAADLDAFLRIVFKTELRLNKEAVEAIRLNHRSRDLFEVSLEITGRKGYASERIRRVQSVVSKLHHMSAADFLETIDGELGYAGYLEFAQNSLGQSADRIRSLWFSLLAIASRFHRPEDFFSRIRVLDQYQPVKKDAAVSLSTLHASKGREFDHVFLLDVLKGIFPVNDTYKTDSERLALEEERRLFYVGVSRARETVSLYHARFGGGRHLRLSLFVTEILEVLERQRPIIHPAAVQNQPDNLPGQRVTHLRFGGGQVVSQEGDALQIQFSDKIRTLSLRLCLEKEFLTFL